MFIILIGLYFERYSHYIDTSIRFRKIKNKNFHAISEILCWPHLTRGQNCSINVMKLYGRGIFNQFGKFIILCVCALFFESFNLRQNKSQSQFMYICLDVPRPGIGGMRSLRSD